MSGNDSLLFIARWLGMGEQRILVRKEGVLYRLASRFSDHAASIAEGQGYMHRRVDRGNRKPSSELRQSLRKATWSFG